MKFPKISLLLLCFFLFCGRSAHSSAITDQIVKLAQQRFRAFADADRATLQQLVADDAIFLYSDGRQLNKAQMLEELAPFPKGYQIQFEDTQVREFGDSAMVCFRLVYHDSAGSNSESAEYLETDTFALRNARWQLVGVHGTAVPYPSHHEISISPALLDDYVGHYKMGDASYAIAREGNQLFGQRSGFPKVPWHPETENIFFVDGDLAGRRIFLRNKTGHVTQMVRIGPEHYVVWTRVSETSPASH